MNQSGQVKHYELVNMSGLIQKHKLNCVVAVEKFVGAKLKCIWIKFTDNSNKRHFLVPAVIWVYFICTIFSLCYNFHQYLNLCDVL